jgi:hypothetical protein
MRRLACNLGAVLLVAAPASAAVITRHATTASFKLTLAVGAAEKMYTAAEVKLKHPTSGEVMVGSMTNDHAMTMEDMSMSGANRHLEVSVASRATGKVVTNVRPSIVLTDTSAMSGMAMPQKVSAVAMYGVGEGMADLHYGDNVKLTAGHVYKVVVAVKGEKATFSFKA